MKNFIVHVKINQTKSFTINIFFDDIEIDSECMFLIVAFAISAGHNLKNNWKIDHMKTIQNKIFLKINKLIKFSLK